MSLSQTDLDKLVQQSEVVSTLMLKLMISMGSDYNRKHPAAVFYEWAVAFEIWRTDTVATPKTIKEISEATQIPPSNVGRALKVLEQKKIIIRVGRYGYARNIEYLTPRLRSPYFINVREDIMDAGRALEEIFGSRKKR